MWCFDGSSKFLKNKLYFILCLYIIHLTWTNFGYLNLFWIYVLVLTEGKLKTNEELELLFSVSIASGLSYHLLASKNLPTKQEEIR